MLLLVQPSAHLLFETLQSVDE